MYRFREKEIIYTINIGREYNMSLDKELEKELEKDKKTEEFDNKEADTAVEQMMESTSESTVGQMIVWAKNNKKIAAIIAVALLVLVSLAGVAINNALQPTTLAEKLEWTIDEDKINELKETLIDGVTINDIYLNSNVIGWEYSYSDGIEYLKVETEQSVDVYNVTDGELEESTENELIEMKKNFIGLKGVYESDMALMYIELNDDYDMEFTVALLGYTDIIEQKYENQVEDVLDEANEDEPQEINIDMDDENLTNELGERTNIEFVGEIISTTEIQVILETEEVITFTWEEEGIVHVVTDEFSEDNLLLISQLCEALTDRTYTYLEMKDPLIDEDDLALGEPTEEELQIEEVMETYIIEVTGESDTEVNFNAAIVMYDEESTFISNGIAFKDEVKDDVAYYQDGERTLYFESTGNGSYMVSGYDNEQNLIIKQETE